MLNLAIDIGNTRVKLGLFKGEDCLDVKIVDEGRESILTEWVTNQKVENVILSRVGSVSIPETVAFLRKQATRFLELGANTPLPIWNAYATPGTLGKDRLAAVAGAYALFPGKTCLVVDAGTCVTYDIIDAGGTYRGGNIAPGIRMRLRAMHAFTARLPEMAPEWPDQWVGDTTGHALQNGALLGTLLEMEGYERLCKEQYQDINILLTGGDSHFLAKKWKSQIFVNQNLVLHGLNKILTYNVERSE